MTQIEPISVIFSLPEEPFEAAERGAERGTVAAGRVPRQPQELDSGTVSLIDNQIDQKTGTMRVKATLPTSADAVAG